MIDYVLSFIFVYSVIGIPSKKKLHYEIHLFLADNIPFRRTY